MAIDPNIALGVRPLELSNPLAQYGQLATIQQAQNQNALAQYQLSSARRADEAATVQNELYAKHFDPKTGSLNLNAFAEEAAQRGQGGVIPSVLKAENERLKAAADLKKTGVETEEKQFKLTKDKLSHGWDSLGNAPTPQDAIKKLNEGVTKGYFDFATANAEVQQLQNMTPEQYQQYRTQKIMGILEAKDKLAYMLPKTKQQDIGGSIVNIQDNPMMPGYGLPVVGAAIKKTPTFADITSQGQLAVSQGQLKVAQDRLAKEGTALDPAENAAISKAILEGRLDPNRVNGRNAKILATTLLANPDANVLELGVSAAGATAAERSLATQTAKMSTAANEAGKMVNVVRDYSSKVDRTEFPTINSIQNAVDKGTGGKEIVQLNTSINALVNSYARAISPTGQPTVSDKNHAREVINSAYSTGQIGAILDVMQQEMDIAREAAGTASTELRASREKARGRGAETPAATQGTGGFKYLGKEGG